MGEEGSCIHSKKVNEKEEEGETPSFFPQRSELVPEHAHLLFNFMNSAGD